MIDKILDVRGRGPILITGPHSTDTIRNGNKLHEKEEYISEVVEKIYKNLGPNLCTIITWNTEFITEYNMYPSDPNFVTDIEKSIWFKKLKEIKLKKPRFYLHIDLHGMKNNSSKNDIEIGMKAIHMYRPGMSQHMKPVIKEAFNELNTKYGFNSKFQGFGMNKYTISEKGAMLGFFSMQMETSAYIRKKIIKDIKYFHKFIKCIKKIYHFWRKEIRKPLHRNKTIRKIKKNFKKTRKNNKLY